MVETSASTPWGASAIGRLDRYRHVSGPEQLDQVLDRLDVIGVVRELLYRATREAGCSDLRYEHRRAAVEQLLALPDAIAWCWAKGGDWRRRIESVVTDVREV